MQKLEFVFSLNSKKQIEILKSLESLLIREDNINSISMYGERIKFSSLLLDFKKFKRHKFNIESEYFNFHLVELVNYQQVSLKIKVKKINRERWWLEWVNELVKLDGFLQAWLVDIEFDYWQNVTDPIEYSVKGKSYEGLPMLSNNLPAPLEQLEIDISKNIGVRKLCVGYTEAIGSHMWLSNDFLQKIGKNIEDLKNALEGCIECIDSKVFYIHVGEEVFKDFSTESKQKKLRDVIYSSAK
ncbi:hypothetical protein [Psychromonas algicola]|uniref:hypothetical protein n=1 Tax=Psychromonas algicola TaxID=2555642 RepID=UPI0010681968|nr:hypothetical protein [Psychromonas sp. RZ5]TEW50610.1 hypothetical protein E2R67_09035 [Psychromonas sp. RZ5]